MADHPLSPAAQAVPSIPTQCSHPGCTELHDDWPAPGRDDLLCQDHWEAYSGDLWWERVRALGELGNVQAEA